MKIHPRLGTGIVSIIYMLLFFIIIKILDIDFEKVKIFYFISLGIIAIIAIEVFEKLYKRK